MKKYLTDRLNNIEENIIFTYGVEDHKKRPFRDILLNRDNQIKRKIYRIPTHNELMLPKRNFSKMYKFNTK